MLERKLRITPNDVAYLRFQNLLTNFQDDLTLGLTCLRGKRLQLADETEMNLTADGLEGGNAPFSQMLHAAQEALPLVAACGIDVETEEDSNGCLGVANTDLI